MLTNPVVFSTLLGLIVNLLSGGAELPRVLTKILTTMGNAFAVAALFSLGLAIYGKLGVLKGRALVLPLFLTLVKVLILPIFIRLLVGVLDPGGGEDSGNFGYIYGTLPTAPSVFAFATQYNASPELIAGATVLCTIASAPLLYMTTILLNAGDDTAQLIQGVRNTGLTLSSIGIVAASGIIIAFVVLPRQRKFPLDLVFYLGLSHWLFAFMYILGSELGGEVADITSTASRTLYGLQEAFHYWQRFWIMLIAVNLRLLVSRK